MKGLLQKACKTVINMETLDCQSYNGNLEKWTGIVDDKRVYIKTNSTRVGSSNYECLAECVSCRLALMLGISDVCMYYLDTLTLGKKSIEVCYSYDFKGNGVYKSYNSILKRGHIGVGVDKYKSVISLVPFLRSRIDTILVFDSIIGNSDRHLRNLGVLRDFQGNFHIPLFDNGNSLFYDKNIEYIKHVLKSNLDYLSSKPFFSTYSSQIKLCDLRRVQLRRVRRDDVYRLVNSYYSGERAKLVGKFLIMRLGRYNLI